MALPTLINGPGYSTITVKLCCKKNCNCQTNISEQGVRIVTKRKIIAQNIRNILIYAFKTLSSVLKLTPRISFITRIVVNLTRQKKNWQWRTLNKKHKYSDNEKVLGLSNELDHFIFGEKILCHPCLNQVKKAGDLAVATFCYRKLT